MEIYETERTYEQQSKIDVARAKSLPYAFISNDKNGEEVLYYHDQNVDIEYDLFGDIVITFDCYDHIDIKTIRQQFLLLINLLENK